MKVKELKMEQFLKTNIQIFNDLLIIKPIKSVL